MDSQQIDKLCKRLAEDDGKNSQEAIDTIRYLQKDGMKIKKLKTENYKLKQRILDLESAVQEIFSSSS